MQAVIAAVIIAAAVAYIVVRVVRRVRRPKDCPPGKSGCSDCEVDCPLRQPRTSTFE